MRKATKIGIAMLMLVMPFGANLATASASTSVAWTGNGSENLPCSDAAHWVLSPAKGITSATLFVDGASYTMVRNGNGSYAADSAGEVTSSSTASVTYDGANTTAFLKLSHCEQGTPPPPPLG